MPWSGLGWARFLYYRDNGLLMIFVVVIHSFIYYIISQLNPMKQPRAARFMYTAKQWQSILWHETVWKHYSFSPCRTLNIIIYTVHDIDLYCYKRSSDMHWNYIYNNIIYSHGNHRRTYTKAKATHGGCGSTFGLFFKSLFMTAEFKDATFWNVFFCISRIYRIEFTNSALNSK